MTDRANRAAEMAESLRAMRRNAKPHWDLHGRPTRHSITMDAARLGDLTDAADLIERMQTELAEWRSVFGHLGATPDDCGNAINSKRLDMQDEISRLSDAADLLAQMDRSLDFYRRRVEELQRWQGSMRDPERTVVCDIIANGHTLAPQFAGGRYGGMKAGA